MTTLTIQSKQVQDKIEKEPRIRDIFPQVVSKFKKIEDKLSKIQDKAAELEIHEKNQTDLIMKLEKQVEKQVEYKKN
jgi:hypothetical protein